jgi:hypothetical protein
MSVIPQSVITSGKWYQPYIHSVPQNYQKAQQKYYSGFTIQAAIDKANGITKKLFPMLLNFYEKREKEFAEKFLKIDHSELSTKIQPFLNNLEDLMQADKGKGESYGLFTELQELAAESNKQEKKARKLAMKNVEKQGKESLKTAKKRAASKVRKESKAKQREAYTQVVSSRVETIIKHHNLKNPNAVLNAVVQNLLFGKPIPAALATDAEKIIEIFKQENRASDRALTGLGTAVAPKTKEGKQKQKTPAEQFVTTMGHYTEDIAVDQILRATDQGVEVLLGDFTENLKWKGKRTKITVKGTGTQNTKKQVQDGEIIITNHFGEEFVMGIDIKYSASTSRTYSRGGNVKSMDEIIGLFPSDRLAKEMMYLLVNSYYHKDTETYNDIIGTSGSGGKKELFNLINMVRGLYGLLPASAVNFTKLDDIGDFVKDDKRFFIMVNNDVILMTDFLGQVQKIVETGGRGTGMTRDIEGLRTGKKNDSNRGIENILDS